MATYDVNDDPPPLRRDLAEDEPDLPTDAELDALKPPLPDLSTDPMAPMAKVPPGPETARPALAEAGDPAAPPLEELADSLQQEAGPAS
jgi:hypothetical protein